MDNSTLLNLLESDREMIMASLNRDRSPQAAQTTLEKALDRLSLRYAEQCGEPAARDAAQLTLKAIRSALPLIDAVDEVRRWQKSANPSAARRTPPLAMGLLAVGVVLELAVILGLMITGGRLRGILSFIEAIIPAALGMAALFRAGVRYGRPEKSPEEVPDVRDEFLVDADKVWHHLRGMMLLADRAIDDARAQSAIARREASGADPDALDRTQTELFAGLLENCYAQDNPDSREMIESLRFYLHGAGLEVVDYQEGRESWFEFLPARRPGTIRPALVRADKLVKKGLAAN